MTKRTNYHDPIPRCQALTQKKIRCVRDATHQHDGKSYCDTHHSIILSKGWGVSLATLSAPRQQVENARARRLFGELK